MQVNPCAMATARVEGKSIKKTEEQKRADKKGMHRMVAADRLSGRTGLKRSGGGGAWGKKDKRHVKGLR